MAEFHWIGSTGNSIDKFFWNNINNWAVKPSAFGSGTQPFQRATTYGRLPQGGDVVKIGTDLHCFSPLLYGGYTGGTGSTNQSGLFGNWCQGQTANSGHGSAGYTAGVTGGGVRFVVATDILGSSSSASVSNGIALGTIDAFNSGNPNKIWGNVATVAANNSKNADALFFEMLSTVNPHADGIGLSSQATVSPESSKYPFPYLGGGVTNDIYRYLKAVWQVSYAGATGSSIAEKEANAWVGGGWTGSESALTTDITKGLTVRLGGVASIGSQSALLIEPGVGAQAQNRIFNVDLKCVGDKVAGSNQIITDASLKSRGNPLHSYVLRNATLRSLVSEGDAAIMLESCTAGSVQTDYHNYTAITALSRVGGLVVDTDNNDPRYHPWVLWFAGSITSGARNTTYGSAASKIEFPWNNRVLVNTNPSTYSTVYANGMSGFSWSTLNPLIGIGEFGGTAGPIVETVGASAAYYTTIPFLEVYSNTDVSDKSTMSVTEAAANTTYNLEFLGNASVASILAHGANVYYSAKANTDATVYVGGLRMREGSVLDFTRNKNMDNWFIGGFTGGGLTTQLVAGIMVEDDTCIVRPSSGTQLVNNKFIGNDGLQGLDARANAFISDKDPRYNPAASYTTAEKNSNSMIGSVSNLPPAPPVAD